MKLLIGFLNVHYKLCMFYRTILNYFTYLPNLLNAFYIFKQLNRCTFI